MICTYQDEIGWMAWKGWNIHIFGEGDSEEEAICDLNMRLERLKTWQNS